MKHTILLLLLTATILTASECTLKRDLTLLSMTRNASIPQKIRAPKGTTVQYLDHYQPRVNAVPRTVLYVDTVVRYYDDKNSTKDLDFGSKSVLIDRDTILSTAIKRGPRIFQSVKPELQKLNKQMLKEYKTFWDHIIPHWKDKKEGQKRWRETLTGTVYLKLFINSAGEVIFKRTVSGRLRNSKCEGIVLYQIRTCRFPEIAEREITELHLNIVFDGPRTSLIAY